MPTRYIDQPVFSPDEIQSLFQEHKMDIGQWPQVVPPAEVVDEYKKEVALNEKFFNDMVDPEMLAQLSKDSLAQAEDPCPLIRTKWGCLFGSHFPSIEKRHGHLSVEIYVAPAWRSKDIDCARMVAEKLLSDPVKQFNAMWRAAGAPKGNQVRLSEGINGALVSVSTYYKPAKNDKTEKDAGSALAHFFVFLCMHGLLDELIQYVGRELPAPEINRSVVDMLPDL